MDHIAKTTRGERIWIALCWAVAGLFVFLVVASMVAHE